VHVLTKIFIVLVSLLAVLLVPLVVVYAHNENSFKQRWQDAQSEANTNRATLDATKQSALRDLSTKDQQIERQNAEIASLRERREQLEAQVRKLEADVASANANQSGIRAELSTLASSVVSSQSLIEGLVTDSGSLRKAALDAEKRLVELDETYRDTVAQLEVAVAARRALQEELQRLSDEHALTLDTLSKIYAIMPDLDSRIRSGANTARIPDKTLAATVLNVQRSNDQVLVEINAGSRDGVKEGWQMTVSRSGTFIGNLTIINVDIDRSVGRLTLESNDRGRVAPGDIANAFAGRR